MAFIAKNFVLCSKTPLFKSDAKLWLYSTGDTLADCLVENYFRPRENLKNQDSPEVGDIIQVIVEYSKIAYLKITAKTEKPYNITVARTFLENEAIIIASLANKADKTTDFVTPITDENLGITQTEQQSLEEKIDLAANSGRMITAQGFWYAKMHAETVAPSAENGTNYADFSQVDGEGNPIIVTYNRVSGSWVQDQTITPPADYDGYVPITSKIWDITEQDGQQGGRVLWNHVSKEFTPYPTIITFESVNLTGDSTVEMPVNPDDDNIANVGFVLDHCASRNVGDIFFTSRTDSVLNGAVPCDGTTYQTTDYTGSQAPGALLEGGKLPYVSLATYATLLATNGSVGVFGWDGIGTTAFKVPTLTDIFLETGTSAQLGDYVAPSLPNVTGSFTIVDKSGTIMYGVANATGAFSVDITHTSSESNDIKDGGTNKGEPTVNFNASGSSSIYNNNTTTVQPQAIRYRAMVQLSFGERDESYTSLAEVAYTGDYGDLLNKPNLATVATSGDYDDLLNKPTIPAAQVNSDWNSSSGVSEILNKPTLSTVATSGDYDDLLNKPTIPAAQVNSDWNSSSGVSEILNKPTIPTVNDSTITLTQGGVTKGSFTLNQSSGATIALDAGGSSAVTSLDINYKRYASLIDTDGNISQITNQDLIELPGFYDMTDANSFEIIVCATGVGSSILSNCNIISMPPAWQDFSHFNLGVNTSEHAVFEVYADNTGVVSQQVEGVTALDNHTKYYIKIAYDGTNYILSISTDGVTYTVEKTVAATYLPGKHFAPYRIGYGKAPTTVHMAEWSIKKNGILVYTGLDAPGLHQRAQRGHEIIAFEAPTASNSYKWYRKYADGWVEQGGINASANTDILLPIAMADTNYTATMPGITSYSSTVGIGADALVVTKTSTTVKYGTMSGFGFVFDWRIEGMASTN